MIIHDYSRRAVITRNTDWKDMSEKVKSGQVDIGISATAMILSSTKDFRFLSTPTYTEQYKSIINNFFQTITVYASKLL